jgi:hypothetical protein
MRAAAQRNKQHMMGSLREGEGAAAAAAAAAGAQGGEGEKEGEEGGQGGEGSGPQPAAISELPPPDGRSLAARQQVQQSPAGPAALLPEQQEWQRWQLQDGGGGEGAALEGGSEAGSDRDAYEFAAMLMDMAELVAEQVACLLPAACCLLHFQTDPAAAQQATHLQLSSI